MAVRVVLCLLLLGSAPALGAGGGDDGETLFETKVRPVLAQTCFPCHGGKKTSGGLRVDSREALKTGGDNGPAFADGKPSESLLVQALRQTHESIKMPPGKRLPDAVIDDFAAWIEAGAPWPAKSTGAWTIGSKSHWAFEPIRAIVPPSGPAPHPIDRFLDAKLAAKGLTPNAPADKRTLLRRLTFDLIGLPPTPEEIAAFLADESPGAYEKVVERLLASPHYGERWGRRWMDVARYADTAGDNADYPVPEARLYRDYIIDAFNADKPYDEFVREQLAGDILAAQGPRERYAERVIATGFLALSRKYATAPEELWHLTMEDTIETTGRAFLGLTLRCARCHDHKFDPTTQRDYYALYGIFASTKFAFAGSEEFASKGFHRADFVPLLPPAEAGPRWQNHAEKLKEIEAEAKRIETDDPLALRLADLNQTIGPIEGAVRDLERWKLDARPFADQLARLRKRRDETNGALQAKLNPLRAQIRDRLRPGLPPDLPAAYAVHDQKPVDVAIQPKGEPDQQGAVVPRAVPKFLDGGRPIAIPAGASGRLQLAEWLTRPEHPLTARVMVNRIWQGHFGTGIVATPSNFGLRGAEPSHPGLLDWLAARFVASGWSIKAMHRLIVTSEAYRRSSAPNPLCAAADPANQLLWRFDRRRLDAESIRDAMLAVSGQLDRSRPGPHPFPPIAQWGWTQHNPFKSVYLSNHRSVYVMTQRIQRHPYLALFDGPDTNTSTDKRSSSTVPLQALYLLNNPFVVEQSRGLARRVLSAESDPARRVALIQETVWGHSPLPEESDRALEFVERSSRELARLGVSGAEAENEAWSLYAKVLLVSNEFLYVD